MIDSNVLKIRLPLPLLETLEREAKKSGNTYNEIVIAALSTYLSPSATGSHSTPQSPDLSKVLPRLAAIEQRLMGLERQTDPSPIAAVSSMPTTPVPLLQLSYEEIEDEPDEILTDFMEPGS